jgi:fumarylacetoacetase
MTPYVQSWIESANKADCDFPLQNLPFCAFVASEISPHLGIGVGNFILDLNTIGTAGFLDSLAQQIREACAAPVLNLLMECGNEANIKLREKLTALLATDADISDQRLLVNHLHPILGAIFTKPVSIHNYTDFYASINHATNVGKLFRPDQPLLPNYKHIPIGYHGRASSIVVSGTPVIRPNGQTKPANSDFPRFGSSQQLDYELEVAAYICGGNTLGVPISIKNANANLFGISLLNDWSARDVQSWEYQPLGPFLGKSFATSVSPWVISMSALEPYRIQPGPRAHDDPNPLPYLMSDAPEAIDSQLEVFITTTKMRDAKLPPHKLSTTNLRELYWTFPQLIAHHTSNGCNLLSGDILASGTVSGASPNSQGSLLEITSGGARPLLLPNGELRAFLEDGDEIILHGFCQREDLPRIGLGECRGIITAAAS